MRKGYLTVFMSLILSCLIAVILIFVEGARSNAISVRADCVTDIGINSVLGEYHRELLEQYDLLYVDMSYGGSGGGKANAEEHLRRYLSGNLSSEDKSWWGNSRDFLAMTVNRASIREYSIASDYNGEVMRSQVLDYMKDSTIEGKAAQLLEHLNILEGLGMDTRDIAAERESVQAQIDAIGLPRRINDQGEEEEVPLNNPADVANATRSSGVLNLVLDDSGVLSKVSVNTEACISKRDKECGVYGSEVKAPGTQGEKLLFNEYMMKKCGRYHNEKDSSALKYQLEYILYGEDLDWENLEKVAKRLLRWREVANVVYAFGDSVQKAEAQALAATLAAITFCPQLEEPVTNSILFAWCYVESLNDIKILLAGGKVPLIKSAQNWHTPITSLLHVKSALSSAGSVEGGLSYDDYLRLMLFMESEEKVNMRLMDIMEMDIRCTDGNGSFRMDRCSDQFYSEIEYGSNYSGTRQRKKKYGYRK